MIVSFRSVDKPQYYMKGSARVGNTGTNVVGVLAVTIARETTTEQPQTLWNFRCVVDGSN